MRTPLLCGLLFALLACSGDPAPGPTPVPENWAHDTGSTFFLQMADTQFGMYSKPAVLSYLGWRFREGSFERETENMEKAIAHANRLRPSFVVICGDLVNTPGHPEQVAEFQRIAAGIDASIPLHLVAGNHDVENEPTPETLASYRETFGRDAYAFRHGEVYGIVLNSQLIHSPAGAA
ncbi:MAG: metallophosphoesterase, partial [Deltaproteobacteria bacterium]|nr:metallophosphoesterase [Deltaproteobacteria bacterium]